jgi:hypothetical protein
MQIRYEAAELANRTHHQDQEKQKERRSNRQIVTVISRPRILQGSALHNTQLGLPLSTLTTALPEKLQKSL